MKAKIWKHLSSFYSTYTCMLNKIYTCESTHMHVCFRIAIESYLSLRFNQKNNIEFKVEFDKTTVIAQVLNKSNWVTRSPLKYMADIISCGTKHTKLMIMTIVKDFANFSSLRNCFFLLNEVSNDDVVLLVDLALFKGKILRDFLIARNIFT